jgi:hypothetical protein
MKESATYQEIVREGIEQGMEKGIEKGIERGRVVEAKSVLLRRGERLLGLPEATERARLDGIADLSRLEDMMDRLWDGTVKTWSELLGTA